MLYDQYRQRMMKLANITAWIKRFRVPILAVLAFLLVTASVLTSIGGIVYEAAACPDSVTYGETLGYEAKAVFTGVRYEYAAEDSEQWSGQVPVRAGNYRVRGVADGPFGTVRYGRICEYTVLPRAVDVRVSQERIGYGELPSVAADLAYSDVIACSRFVYGDLSKPNSTVTADEGAISVRDAEGRDVSESYVFRPVTGTVGFDKREITVTVSDSSQIYDGNELKFDGYELDGATPLAEGDTLTASFEARRTDAGETENVPKIRIKGSKGLDVTGNYNVRIVPGKLTVKKRPLYVRTEGAEKVYDGAPLSCGGYELEAAAEKSGLLTGHRISSAVPCLITDAGVSENWIDFRIRDDGGRDVSENYSVFYDFGTLRVKPRPVSVATEIGSWVYDGTAHENPNYSVSAGEGESGLLSGHRHALDAPAQIVEAGTSANETTILVFDGEGRDVTGNYAICYETGTLTVTPRPIVVKTGSNTWIYDASAHSEFGTAVSEISQNPLVEGHETRAGEGTKIVDRGTVKNELNVLVYAADGRDVTANYAVSCQTGTLTVLPRPIVAAAGSAEKIYDGTPLESGAYETSSDYGDGLVADHVGVIENEGSQTDAGTGTNRVLQFFVFDGDRNVTFNYVVSFASGTLTVLPRPVTVTAGSSERIYDGTALESAEFEISSEVGTALVLNHRAVAETSGMQTDAYSSLNSIVRIAVFADDRDVTFNYFFTFETGTLTVLPRPIIVATVSRSWIYDGQFHSDSGHEISENSKYALVEDQFTVALWATEVINAGKTENVSSIFILTANSRDVTFNYSIETEYGTLEIVPRPITVTAVGGEKIYDGLPLKSKEIVVTSEYDPPVVPGQQAYFQSEESQTDVGERTCSVTLFNIYDDDGNDRTANYAVSYQTDRLTVTLRSVWIKGGSFDGYYNGMTYSYNDAEAEEQGSTRGLLNWQRLYVETTGRLTDAGVVPNAVVPESVLILDEGRDVTFNYSIELLDGELLVYPRPITVTAGSAEKMYDGTPLICREFELSSDIEELFPVIVSGERIEVVISSSRMPIGRTENAIDSVRVLSGKRDVTANYQITLCSGFLTVQIPDGLLKIKTKGAEKIYDGTPLGCETFEVVNTLPKGYSVEIICDGSVTDVGTAENTVTVRVTSPSGEDVSDYIRKECEFGILEVRPRPVVIETNSNTWPFDGWSHVETGHRVSKESQYGIADGQRTFVYKYTRIFDVGVKQNVLELDVYSGNGEKVTDNYVLSYEYGFLEITASDYTGGGGNLNTDGDIGLNDPSGGDGGGGGGGGGGGAAVKVFSEYGGMVYLRLMNYGNYNGRKWGRAESYGGWLNEKYCLNYLTGAALQKGGYQSSLVRIDAKGSDYLLPYYMGLGDDGYEIQASDVWYRGNTKAIYELRSYLYDYVSDGPISVDLGEYRGAELAYRNFVKNNYLSVPGSTLSYLNTVIAREGFRQSGGDVIGKVASYIQGAAKYNLNYNRLMDKQSDIVVSFLRDYREGICQHYAAAATMLYRALGIPARCTIGYAGSVNAGTWTDFTADNAHAWVEVYIDGTGWVQVEVTGSGPVFGSGDGVSELTVKPADGVKKYDGLPLTPDAVAGVGEDKFLFRELLNEGYTYRAEYRGSQTDLGTSYSLITSFVLFDPDGNEAKHFKFRFQPGKLTVVDQTIVTVHPYQLQKYYDGTPLTYQSDDYYVTGLPSEYQLNLKLTGQGLTDAGLLEEDLLRNLPLTITDGVGRDVTQKFYVVFDDDGLLMVSRRKITVTSISVTKIYDGTPLTSDEFWISSGSLAEGHTVSVEMKSSITDVGVVSNVIESIVIKDAAGRNVTRNYDIRTVNGKLTVVSD